MHIHTSMYLSIHQTYGQQGTPAERVLEEVSFLKKGVHHPLLHGVKDTRVEKEYTLYIC